MPLPSPSTTVTADSSHQRPQLPHRHSSTASSQPSLSQSETSSTHSHPPQRPHLHHAHSHHHHHKAQRHVVGGGGHGARLGARNTSFGHNLNKLPHHSSSKMPHDANSSTVMSIAGTPTANPQSSSTVTAAKDKDRPGHKRSKSGDSSGTGEGPSSPRVSHANVKRNASAYTIARNHSHTALKKNYSSGQLPRNLSGKALNKASAHRPAAGKRKHSGKSDKSVPASPASPVAQQPTVRFALADAEHESDDEENEWTEESASVSPNITRDNTRHNSVVLDPSVVPKDMDPSAHDVTSGEESTSTVIHAPEDEDHEESQRLGTRKSQESAIKQINGEGSFQASGRPHTLDADAITSRLLQRKAPSAHSAEPQLSSVSATAQSNTLDHASLSHSEASTLAEGTPGRDLVSRFVNANSTDGTPREGNMLHHKQTPPRESGDLDASKRNKSAPNMADRGPISPVAAHARSLGRRSGTSTPSDLPPSRTQQKLLLQRASSAIEPQKHIPAVLPRPSAAQLLGNGLSLPSAEGSTPAQVHALFAQVNKEYNVVRRYRNPVADALARQREIARPERRALVRKAPRNKANENGDGHESPVSSFKGRDERGEHWPPEYQRRSGGNNEVEHNGRHSRHEEHRHAPSKREDKGHKSRVSFDLPSSVTRTEDTDDEGAGLHSRGGSMSASQQHRAMGGGSSEAYEICRRMWEMGEPAEVAG